MIKKYWIEHKRDRTFFVIPPECNWDMVVKLFGNYLNKLFGKNSFRKTNYKWYNGYTLTVKGIDLRVTFLSTQKSNEHLVRVIISKDSGKRFQHTDDFSQKIMLHLKRKRRFIVTNLKKRILSLVKNYKSVQNKKTIEERKEKIERIITASRIARSIGYDVSVADIPDELYLIDSLRYNMKIKRNVSLYDFQFFSTTEGTWNESFIIEKQTLHQIKLLIPIVKKMFKVSGIVNE